MTLGHIAETSDNAMYTCMLKTKDKNNKNLNTQHARGVHYKDQSRHKTCASRNMCQI